MTTPKDRFIAAINSANPSLDWEHPIVEAVTDNYARGFIKSQVQECGQVWDTSGDQFDEFREHLLDVATWDIWDKDLPPLAPSPDESQKERDEKVGRTDFPVGTLAYLRGGGPLLTVTGHDLRGPVVALASQACLSELCVPKEALTLRRIYPSPSATPRPES